MAVYPRWRGEHTTPIVITPSPRGLSPLARGTLSNKDQTVCWMRFIPAGAGNTLSVNENLTLLAVYPRWRGEHSKIINGLSYSYGLSPLARGTLYPIEFKYFFSAQKTHQLFLIFKDL
ncbi:hypothetical protein BN855_29860 [Salmonella enterica subsp. enterica serovar Bovismorbificans str. 3114]|nr:hypothetical protein BN855_29860 [Salmonella enterica subsp. enterica serovar Bovismorbificans str. 3114]